VSQAKDEEPSLTGAVRSGTEGDRHLREGDAVLQEAESDLVPSISATRATISRSTVSTLSCSAVWRSAMYWPASGAVRRRASAGPPAGATGPRCGRSDPPPRRAIRRWHEGLGPCGGNPQDDPIARTGGKPPAGLAGPGDERVGRRLHLGDLRTREALTTVSSASAGTGAPARTASRRARRIIRPSPGWRHARRAIPLLLGRRCEVDLTSQRSRPTTWIATM